MIKQLEVLFTPADFGQLPQRDLTSTVCVVFDVLRATSSMVTALAHGADGITPVADISEALALRKDQPALLLAGERNGLRIGADLTGSIPFDLGNSPREFTREKVNGRAIATTTTNGTRALRACRGARTVFIGCFLNLAATADALQSETHILLVCSGTFEQVAYEDVLGAGALCDVLQPIASPNHLSDSARIALELYRLAQANLPAALGSSRNGRRLLEQPDLRDDVAFCAQRDRFPLVAVLEREGAVKRLSA
jgi:2-phosphosulfolactate phosphatase